MVYEKGTARSFGLGSTPAFSTIQNLAKPMRSVLIIIRALKRVDQRRSMAGGVARSASCQTPMINHDGLAVEG
jgi:hypothetical protein